MYIDGVLIESIDLDIPGYKKATLKQKFLEELAHRLTDKHIDRIIQTRFWPEFYLEGVPSRMNAGD